MKDRRRRTCMELFQRSRTSARRVVLPFLEHVPRFHRLPRVACRVICDFRGSFVFGSLARWNPEDSPGESDGMHIGTEDPVALDVAQTFLQLLLERLDGAIFVTWQLEEFLQFLIRHSTLPAVPKILSHLDGAVELQPMFQRLGRGGYRAHLTHVAAMLANIPTRSQLFSQGEITAAVVEAYLDPAVRTERPYHPEIAFWEPEAWAQKWTAYGDEVYQRLLEEDGRLFLRRLQETDHWLVTELFR